MSLTGAPSISIAATMNYGSFAYSIGQYPLYTPNTTLLGIPFSSPALLVTVPYFVTANISHSSPLAGADNILTVSSGPD